MLGSCCLACSHPYRLFSIDNFVTKSIFSGLSWDQKDFVQSTYRSSGPALRIRDAACCSGPGCDGKCSESCACSVNVHNPNQFFANYTITFDANIDIVVQLETYELDSSSVWQLQTSYLPKTTDSDGKIKYTFNLPTWSGVGNEYDEAVLLFSTATYASTSATEDVTSFTVAVSSSEDILNRERTYSGFTIRRAYG